MSAWSDEAMGALHLVFDLAGDPARREPMAAYMKHRFAFLGIAAPERVRLTRAALAPLGRPAPRDALDLAAACWAEPEREWQYVGAGQLTRVERRLSAEALDELAGLITTRSWWDTVDELAGHPVCSIVARHPDQRKVMDRWLASDDIWLARSAILHQLGAKERTDADWLFAACLARAEDKEFFIRKAIGWALRTCAHRGPAEAAQVRWFLAGPGDTLSGLSKREALKRVRH